MKIFTRSKHVTCDKTGDNTLETRSCLVDTMHEIEVFITIDIEKREITSARAEFLRAPYIFCSGASENTKNLSGLKIDDDKIGNKIRAAVGGPGGCFHIVDLTLDAVKAIKQSLYSFITGSLEKRLRTFDNFLHDTCFAHSHTVEEKIKVHLSPNIIIDLKKNLCTGEE
ncbi:MAG: DUF2889 domain-containing protein [Bacillota bacterium]